MIYEHHLTVDHTRPDFDLQAWIAFCIRHDAKPLDIRLHTEEIAPLQARQVMYAAVIDAPADQDMLDWKARLVSDATRDGFAVLRSKLEVPLDKSGVFQNVPYHECHIKSLIPCDKVGALVGRLLDAGWMASYNDLFTHDLGVEKWYFTQRAYSEHFIQAGREFAERYSALTEVNWYTVRMEMETVIEDSNPLLDEGWA